MAITVALTFSCAASAGRRPLHLPMDSQLSNLPPIADTVHAAGLNSLIAGASTVAALIIVASEWSRWLTVHAIRRNPCRL